MNNRKKVSAVIFAVLLSVVLSCVPVFAATIEEISTIKDLDGRNIGVQTGVLYEDHIKDTIQDEEWFYYKMPNDMIPALKSNKIDAYLIEEVGYYAQHYEHSELARLDEIAGSQPFCVIVGNNENQELYFSQIQEFIQDRSADGWLRELFDYWVTNWNPETCRIENIPETTGENGTVTIAIEGGYEPFSFESNGQFSGFDIEFMMNFCAAYGYNWDFQAMEFDAIAPGAISGKYDFGMNIALEDERKDASVLSDPYYTCDLVFVVENVDQEKTGFIEGIKDSFYKTFIKENRWKLFARGIGTTMLITLCSAAFGTILGFAVYMACRHGNKITNGITKVASYLISGVPTVVFLMILAFIVFADSKLSATWISVLGFTLIFGCEMFDMLCVGCNAIPRGQTEASRALGYSDGQSFFQIILPQAAKHFMPIYRNSLVALIKETSVVGYIAVMDLTKMGDLVRSRTYEAFFALIAVAVVYLLLEALLVAIVKKVQINIDPKHRSEEKILEGIKVWE